MPTHLDQVTTLPGLKEVKDLELAGYLPLSNTDTSSALFYWFVENRAHDANAPIVLWLNGGPGAASLYGFFMENGPYLANKDGTLSARFYSWTQQADYWIIDQPAGVGFSYGHKKTFSHESVAMDQLYYAIKTFFHDHPEFAAKTLYLAGESYAGKYIPQIALRIITGNQQEPNIHLKGILLGDAWVNPRLQQSANANFAYSHGLIDKHGYTEVLKLYAECKAEIDKTTPSSLKANQVCGKIQDFIQKESGALNLANIATGVEPDETNMIRYLNTPKVRKALHVDARAGKFKTFSDQVSDQLQIGEQDSLADLYPKLLAAGIRIWLYNGLEDGKDSNFMSTDLWLSALDWPGKKEFEKTRTCVWQFDGHVAGYVKTTDKLTQIKIRNAGHIAPADQPARLLDLLDHFIHNRELCGNPGN